MIEFENVSYGYEDNKKVLESITFKIEDGDFVGIIGHTGSGKSTLIQMMNGLLKPDSGTIRFRGENIFGNGYNLRELKFRVGVVFQYPDYQLFETTVIKDVMYGPMNMGMTQNEAMDAAKQALSLVGISEDKFNKSPFELSGGEKKKVSIAGILAMNPEVLVLDEPVAGLEPEGRRNLLKLLEKIRNENHITIVMVSHSMENVADYCNHVLVMNEGKLELNGTPEEVFRQADKLEKMGLSSTVAYYIMRELEKRGIVHDDRSITMKEAYGCLEKLL